MYLKKEGDKYRDGSGPASESQPAEAGQVVQQARSPLEVRVDRIGLVKRHTRSPKCGATPLSNVEHFWQPPLRCRSKVVTNGPPSTVSHLAADAPILLGFPWF